MLCNNLGEFPEITIRGKPKRLYKSGGSSLDYSYKPS